jgi:23S rRNA (guanosine2251-2'-O)-methyltransferase
MHLVFQCTNPECDLRFLLSEKEKKPTFCPRCKSPFLIKKIAQDLLISAETSTIHKKPQIEVLLDNIRSTLNVGSIFRTADGAGIQKIHLCGITPTPEHPKMIKTGLGAEWSVPWEYHSNGLKLALQEKQNGVYLVCLEIAQGSRSIFDSSFSKADQTILLVIGNEVTGIDPEITAIADGIFHIPMSGYKKSLNVSVAFGIIAYQLMFSQV